MMKLSVFLLLSTSLLHGGGLSRLQETGAFDPSWMLGPFVRDEAINPVLIPNPNSVFECPMRHKLVAWEHDNVFNPAAATRKGILCVLYRAEDDSGQGIGGHTSRIGLATTRDGKTFTRLSHPVLFPAEDAEKRFEWTGGCEDPRIVETDSGYLLTYTSYDRKTARLCCATSSDLVHWKKHGPVFAKASGGKYIDSWSKSGAIVTKQHGDHFRATKIGGYYWMYWGEGAVSLAKSDNLIDWEPVVNQAGNIEAVLPPRPGTFDSGLTESGPPAVITDKGILLIYNGKNADVDGEPTVSAGAYSAGQALFSLSDPSKLINRTSKPFFKPEKPYEKTGQYQKGTVFVEGLASFHHKLWLFYGTADSKVAVATAPEK